MVHRNSKKRQAILDCLRAREDHPTVEMLYQSLKPAFPELSLGTVYRNLGLLAREGQAVSVGSFFGQERFDGRLDPHSHFVCRRCRRVMDLELPDTVSDLYPRMEQESGILAEGHSLTISGLCPDCKAGEAIPLPSDAIQSSAARLSR